MPTRRQIERSVRLWRRHMGFGRGAKFILVWHGEGNPCDSREPGCYASAECYPKYRRCFLHFEPQHGNWESAELGKIDNTVRHELAHYILSPLSNFASRMIRVATKDKAARSQLAESLDEIEDEIASFLADMPVWELVE